MARLVKALLGWFVQKCTSYPKECKDQANRFADWLLSLLRRHGD